MPNEANRTMNAPTFANAVGRRLVGSALTLALSLIATGTSEAETSFGSKPERSFRNELQHENQH